MRHQHGAKPYQECVANERVVSVTRARAHRVIGPSANVRAGDVVLKNGVPLLQAELLGTRPGLRGDELLQVRDGVVGVALDPDFLAWKSISVSRGVRRTRDIIKHDE